MDDDMLDMLRGSLRHVLTDTSVTPLAERLADLGWSEVVDDDPSTALRTLFELKGDTLSSADALGPRLGAALGIALGERDLGTATVALPSPFGASTTEGQTVTVEALSLSAVPVGSVLVVPVGTAPRLTVLTVGPEITCSPAGDFDEAFGLHRLTGTVPASSVRWIDDMTAAGAWIAVVAHARWLISCELVGIGHHVIRAAAQYTGERVQYGRAIGTFQALQHRIASAHSLVIGAGHLAQEAGSGDEWTALVAKAMAGQAAEFACTQAQQCYGAIGFTWEHEFHRYLRRTYSLDRLFGDWRSLEHEIGSRLQTTGVVPHIGSL